MNLRASWRAAGRNETVRLCLFLLGCLLIVVTPAVAILPGPGGIFTFAGGLALALRNSAWAKRRYVEIKRRWPKIGSWCDWGLRRRSAKRRGKLVRTAKGKSD
ncbi:hypothetical protein CLG96_15440 [Sphingomonas oleivorans]|uniref:Transmembrane protein (PGPGW) n=1 Tax=Sphingomonas oleivorans TaxID=1735121 RepID=A0A2T5FV26_9SPHN|nr:hypothetical protein [Sphingomonas oleivorans]PTQ08582.1 hypothetical protein CLG96_15440 [Sphingomonas oleivorans]